MNYEIMDDVVEKLCDSLINHPEQWVFNTYTFYHKANPKIEYWSHGVESITETYSSVLKCDKVFSHDQGKRIYNAYLKARETQATVQQQKIINAFKTTVPEEVSKPLPILPETKKTSRFKFWPF